MPGSKRGSSLAKKVDTSGEPSVKVEHCKGHTAKCHVCRKTLRKGDVRINAEGAGFFHPECFRKEKGFEGTPESLEGFDALDDQEKRQLEQFFKEQPAEEQKENAPAADEQAGGEEKNEPVAEQHAAVEEKDEPVAEEKAQADEDEQSTDKEEHAAYEDITIPLPADENEQPEGAEEANEKPQDAAPEGKKRSSQESELESDKIPAGQQVEGPPAAKKSKIDDDQDAVKTQNEVLKEVRRLFYTNMLEPQMVTILKANDIFKEDASVEESLEMLVDAAVFGVPEPCPECNGIVAFSKPNNTYACLGCDAFTTKEPPRKQMVIPEGLADNDFIQSYDIPKLEKRLIEEKRDTIDEDVGGSELA